MNRAAAGPAPPSRFQRALDRIERFGNALPHPASLFVILCGLLLVASWAFSTMGVQVAHPLTGETVAVTNLLSDEGLRRIILGVLPNFISFAPLGSVLVSLLGLAVAEHAGLFSAVVRLVVSATPPRVLTLMVVFAGANSHTLGDVGYVLLLPLASALFHMVGRHPLAGLAAAFAGVSGGFAANLLLSPTDVILAGLTQEAARIIDEAYTVTPLANYFFLGSSVFLVTAVGTFVTEYVVEPRLGAYTGDVEPEPFVPVSAAERCGLWWALAAIVGLAALVAVGLQPGGVLQDPENPGFVGSYFVRGIVFFIFLFGLVPGVAYGVAAGTITSDKDVYKGMQRTLELVSSYLVVVFFVAQFVNFFNWTNLGLVLAVNGAAVLQASGLGPVPLLLGVILLTTTIDLMVGSASAKWAMLAPVFVPMFMLLGYAPELTQVAYRVGDSTSNIITPLMSNFPLVLMFAQRYVPSAGIGTMTATMLPYSMGFLACWSLMLVLWVLAGLPVGPGAPLFLS
ncbi:MAG: AbgT family transporter [Acidobacteriota bacterium]